MALAKYIVVAALLLVSNYRLTRAEFNLLSGLKDIGINPNDVPKFIAAAGSELEKEANALGAAVGIARTEIRSSVSPKWTSVKPGSVKAILKDSSMKASNAKPSNVSASSMKDSSMKASSVIASSMKDSSIKDSNVKPSSVQISSKQVQPKASASVPPVESARNESGTAVPATKSSKCK